MTLAFVPTEAEPVMETEFLLKDALAFFSGQKSGNMGTHAYSEPHFQGDQAGGAEYWRQFLEENKDYYVYSEEAALIQEKAKLVGSWLPEKTMFVDLGPGERSAVIDKSFHIVKATKRPREYRAVDTNETFARQAAHTIVNTTGVVSNYETRDFLRGMLQNKHPAPVALMLFGGFLCNLPANGVTPADQLQNTLRILRASVPEGSHLIITQDSNQDKDSLMRAYDHPLVGKLMLSPLHRVKRDLATTGFEPEKFESRVEWDAENQTIRVLTIPTEDMTFSIEGHGFTLSKGQELCVSNSYKFHPDTFMAAARQAGWKNRSTLTPQNGNADGQSHHYLHVFQAAPKP